MLTVLKSKLLVPKISKTIARERLKLLLEDTPRKKLTTVVAPAGYGKTTLIAQAVQDHNWASVWYRLGESDRNLVSFLSYLVAGLKKVLPSFGKNTLHRIQSIRNPKTEWLEIITLLIGELEQTVSDDLVIVLEDYHHIQSHHEISRTLDFFIENLPSNLHLIVISRSEPELPLSRLRSIRELIEIKTEDLAFTDRETDQLCRELFEISLEAKEVNELRQKTDGWITGLILFYHTVKGKKRIDIEKQVRGLKGSTRIFSSYLQENVLENLPKSSLDFLLQTSILPRLQVDFCDAFLEIKNSREILLQLENNRLFTFVLDEEKDCFFYHDLFRDFLQKRLEQVAGNAAVEQLQLKAAALCETFGYNEEALNIYLSSKAYESACILFEASIKDWLAHGRYYLIRIYAERIPRHILEKHSWYMRVQTYLAALSFDYMEAIKKIGLYLKHNKQKSHEDIQDALFMKAMLHFELGDYLIAESQFKSLLKEKNLLESLEFEILRYLVFTSASLQKFKKADKYFNTLLLLMEKQNNRQQTKDALISYIQCRKHFIADEFEKAESFGLNAIELLKEEDTGLIDHIRAIHVFVSSSLFHLGRFSEGLKKAEQGIIWFEASGFKNLSQPEVFLPCISANCIGLGNIAEGTAHAEKGLKLFSDRGFAIWQARFHWLLCESNDLAGNPVNSEQHIRDAIKACPTVHGRRYFYKIRLNQILTESGRYDEVNDFLNEGKNRILTSSSQSEFLLLHAHLYWATGKKKMALRKFQNALSIMQENCIYLGLLAAKVWAVELLVKTWAQGKMKSYIQDTISLPAGPWKKENLISVSRHNDSKIKKAAIELLSYLPQNAPQSLIVNCLGQFSVYIGGQKLLDERWKSQQAKTLFKFLVFKQSRGFTPKDTLMELLWPDQSPTASAKRLQVVLTILRKILEPELPRGVPSSYIIREGNGYRLSLGDGGSTDFDTFSRLMEKGRNETEPGSALDYFNQAESIYKQDFLEEDLYSDWCSLERNRLKNEHLSLLNLLMDHHEEEGDYSVCIDLAEKYLISDPCAETIYRRLMLFHLKNGSQEQIRRVYERCQKHLTEELDSPISHETEVTYLQYVEQSSI